MTDTFGNKMAIYKPTWSKVDGKYWDNGEEQCNICNLVMLRTGGYYVYFPKGEVIHGSVIRTFFVCSELCGEMFILAKF